MNLNIKKKVLLLIVVGLLGMSTNVMANETMTAEEITQQIAEDEVAAKMQRAIDEVEAKAQREQDEVEAKAQRELDEADTY